MSKWYSEIIAEFVVIVKMKYLLIFVGMVNFIASRDITTISYSERHYLAENGFANIFKKEGAFVRHRA